MLTSTGSCSPEEAPSSPSADRSPLPNLSATHARRRLPRNRAFAARRSNNKQSWAKKKPMTCEEDLLTQVQLSAADAALKGNPGQRYYVYRNSIKALSWFSSVRELLVDPAYAKWILPFSATPPINGSRYYSPPCDSNYDPPLCSALFHDQTQSPAYPKGDGDCAAPACDTGAVPSGEYVSARCSRCSAPRAPRWP